MLIPHDQLQPDTLRALIEEFITRDGAVQGHGDMPLESRMQSVMRQLETGNAAIVFDEENQTCSILLKNQLSATMPEEE